PHLRYGHAEDGIRYRNVTGVQTCALPICPRDPPDPPDRPRSARTSAAWVNRPAVGNSALARADGAAPGTRARAASQAHDASADGRSAQGAGGDLRGG